MQLKRWHPIVLLLTLTTLSAGASPAHGHATLERVSPENGTVVKALPQQAELVFSEPVTAADGAVRLFTPAGVDISGPAAHPAGHPEALAIPIKPASARGTYTLSYRVISADGHVVGAATTFSVGAPSRTVPGLATTDAQRMAAPRIGLPIARTLQYAALTALVGALLLLLVLWPAARVDDDADARLADRTRRVVRWSSVLGVLSAAGVLWLSAMETASAGPFSDETWTVLGTLLTTRFGVTWAVVAGVWVVLALMVDRRVPGRLGGPALAAGALVLVFAPGVAGHAAARDEAAVLIPANAAHVLSATVWLGGVLALLTLALPVLATVPAQLRKSASTTLVAAFTRVAVAAAAVVVLTGALQSLLLLTQPSDLVRSPYGRYILIKLLLVVGLVAVGLRQRGDTLPRLRSVSDPTERDKTEAAFAHRLRAEVLLLVGILVATGLLAGASPPEPAATAASKKPVAQGRIGPARFRAVLRPAATGANVLSLTLTDPRTGRPFKGADEIIVRARNEKLALGPITGRVVARGGGRFAIDALQLTQPGDWTFELVMRVGAFNEYAAEIERQVRPAAAPSE